jgi:hypothetical protein
LILDVFSGETGVPSLAMTVRLCCAIETLIL